MPDSVVLWTRIDPAAVSAVGSAAAPLQVNWEIASDDSFRSIVGRGAAPAVAELGHSVHVEVPGLRPGREYWYRFMVGGEASGTGRTATAPDPAAMPNNFRFAFASCQNYMHGYFTAYRHLVSDQPDLVVHLGDYIYERNYGNNPVRPHESGEIITLDQYRARYALYRTDPDLALAHAHCPWVVTPDDHEVENNYANDIAEDNAPRGEFLLRRAAAYQAYYEFMPLRRAALPSGPSIQLYRRFTFGRLAEFNVLDTRQYRGDQPCGDGGKVRCADSLDPALSLLGRTQEQWLASGMRQSRARWNILANQVMLSDIARGTPEAPTYSMDQWPGYTSARQRLLDFISEAKPANPIVLTGDIHSNWVSDIKADFDRSQSPTVGVEFVGTSISAGGDGNESTGAAALARNAHLRHYSNRRGYVLNTLTPERWTADYRIVPFVTRTDAPVETRASFVVENGRPGVSTA
jgi:alkaline phosphatase D